MDLKKIKHNKIVNLTVIFIVVVFFFGYRTVDAATIQINSNSTKLSPGGITTLSVAINSEGVNINNAEAKIIFPADLLEVVSVSKSNSVFSLWVEEPTYSNIAGTVNFNGGVPTPGFSGSSGTVISIIVKAKKTGQADIIFSDAAVRANDGLGTDVLRVKTGKTLSIVQKEEPIIETQQIVPTLIALQVTSPTHPSQELWYRNNSPTFVWKLPAGVDAIQTGIDNNTSGSPRVVFSPAISERTVKDQGDGIWYFKVRARNGGEWGPISTYIARIDNTIPQKNEVIFSYNDEKKVLNIKADIIDETSGLDHYEIFVNDVLIKKVLATEFVNGNYELVYKNTGDHIVKLVAVDRAGNNVESSGSFKVTAVTDSVPDQSKPPVSTGLSAIPVIYFIIAILSAVLILVIGAFRLGRHYSKFQHKFSVRTSLTKGDYSKVLLMIKKRLEKHLEILQRIRQNRILSKEEKQIKEAIEGDLDEVDRAIEEQKGE